MLRGRLQGRYRSRRVHQVRRYEVRIKKIGRFPVPVSRSKLICTSRIIQEVTLLKNRPILMF